MSSITRFVLNLSIGAKLGIASGLGVLLVATMVIIQMQANTAMRVSMRARPGSRRWRGMRRR